MENLLFKKLQIKTGFNVSVVNCPINLPEILGDTPEGLNLVTHFLATADAYLIFAITKKELFSALDEIKTSIKDLTLVWIFYPKAKTALASDLNLMQSWSDLTLLGLAPCSSAAVNQVWTAIRVKPAHLQKKSGIGNAEIANNEYKNFIDVVNKQITLPEDLQQRLVQEPEALAFYEQLAYSHRKEYVLWIVTAKQEKTRADRIDKMIGKLLNKKKNPSDK